MYPPPRLLRGGDHHVFFQGLRHSEFGRLLVTLALPIALQNLFTSTMTLVEVPMVGPLNEVAVASVGVPRFFSRKWIGNLVRT